MKREILVPAAFALIITLEGTGQSFANPPECAVYGTEVQCPMVLNAQTWYHLEPGEYLRLNNSTGGAVQINEVRPVSNAGGTWQETCVGIDGADPYRPPPVPGIGEVGCMDKGPDESGYQVLRWDGITTALAVESGHWLYVGMNGSPTAPHDFLVTVLPNISGIQSWRQPKADIQGFTYCNGAWQVTPGSWEAGWQNTRGHNLTLRGALVYATSGANPNTHSVQAACLYIVMPDRITVRVQYCQNGLNARGVWDLPDQVIYPNEYVIGQAGNSCPSGGVWDWAAYFFVTY